MVCVISNDLFSLVISRPPTSLFIIGLQWVSHGKYSLCHWALGSSHEITANKRVHAVQYHVRVKS
jgi:hypothetical protein